jgi:hypothetical protein
VLAAAGMSAAAISATGAVLEGGAIAYAIYDTGKTAVEVKQDLAAGRLDDAAAKTGGTLGAIVGGVGANKVIGKAVPGALPGAVGEAGAVEANAPKVAQVTEVGVAASVNETGVAILRDGFYEVNGFKFSEYYYNKVWSTGRGAPSLVAREILASGETGVPDALKTGFYRYESMGWEMVYNPTTKEVWHIQPIK